MTPISTQNADPSEINKFHDDLVRWWDLDGPMAMLHRMNSARLSFIQQYTPLTNQCALDVGCGGGLIAEALHQAGAQVTAIDLNSSAINVAKHHAAEQSLSINYHCTSIEDWVSHAQRYDVITCLELLEHLPQPASMVERCASLLKPGGTLYLSTIKRSWSAYFNAIVIAEHLLQILPKGTHQFERFLNPSELDTWANQHNLTLQGLSGLRYHPFTKNFSLADNISVNYIMAYKKPQ